eukprot:scaffold34692_cov15-Tisochrysis_lutea.AAC.1
MQSKPAPNKHCCCYCCCRCQQAQACPTQRDHAARKAAPPTHHFSLTGELGRSQGSRGKAPGRCEAQGGRECPKGEGDGRKVAEDAPKAKEVGERVRICCSVYLCRGSRECCRLAKEMGVRACEGACFCLCTLGFTCNCKAAVHVQKAKEMGERVCEGARYCVSSVQGHEAQGSRECPKAKEMGVEGRVLLFMDWCSNLNLKHWSMPKRQRRWVSMQMGALGVVCAGAQM